MNRILKQQCKRLVRKSSLYIIISGISFIIIFPLFFLVSFSFMSDYQTYSEWPKPLIPSFKADFKIDRDEEGYHLYIFNKSENKFMPFGPPVFYDTHEDVCKLQQFIRQQANCRISISKIKEYVKITDKENNVKFSLKMDLLLNYILFFQVINGAPGALLNSLFVAAVTILISLTIGGIKSLLSFLTPRDVVKQQQCGWLLVLKK